MRCLRIAGRGLQWLIGAVIVGLMLISIAVIAVKVTDLRRVRTELTGSMSPTIKVGALVVYERSNADDLHLGQVISFARPGFPVPVTHRITSLNSAAGTVTIVTRGDANNTADPEPVVFAAQQQVWRVSAVVPAAGWFLDRLSGTRGAEFVISLMPLYLVLPVPRRGRHRKRARVIPAYSAPEPPARHREREYA